VETGPRGVREHRHVARSGFLDGWPGFGSRAGERYDRRRCRQPCSRRTTEATKSFEYPEETVTKLQESLATSAEGPTTGQDRTVLPLQPAIGALLAAGLTALARLMRSN
jgi:hypothetical protein